MENTFNLAYAAARPDDNSGALHHSTYGSAIHLGEHLSLSWKSENVWKRSGSPEAAISLTWRKVKNAEMLTMVMTAAALNFPG